MADEYREPGPDTYSADKTQQGHQDQFPCTLCSAHFPNNNLRATHMRAHNGKSKALLCRDCPREFAERRGYEAHIREHANAKGKKAECDVCDYANKSEDVIRRHKLFDHAADGSHSSHCEECEYQNESCCGVSLHTLYMHPGKAAPLSKSSRPATPPLTPPDHQPPTNSRPRNEISPEHKSWLQGQEEDYLALSKLERVKFNTSKRNLKRILKAAAKEEGRPAPDSS